MEEGKTPLAQEWRKTLKARKEMDKKRKSAKPIINEGKWPFAIFRR
jgi:hypothetical protein